MGVEPLSIWAPWVGAIASQCSDGGDRE